MKRFIRTCVALVIGAALVPVSPAAAQYYPAGGWYRSGPAAGYTVRAWGVYGGPVLPPGPGGYEAYYPGRPIVTVTDPWGRVAEVPLRPKVLYYSDQFLTPHGAFYPTSIVVTPTDRRPRTVGTAPSTLPPVPREEIPAPKVERPAAREGAPPPKAQPPSGNLPPPPPGPSRMAPLPPLPSLPDRPTKSGPPEPPIPRAIDLDRPAATTTPAVPESPRSSDVPAVPKLPRLPDIPALPGSSKPAGDKVPSLGPSPMDAVSPPRPMK